MSGSQRSKIRYDASRFRATRDVLSAVMEVRQAAARVIIPNCVRAVLKPLM
jgi:hypothetical protein